MTEKLQKLTKSLAEEKAAAEKLQKSNSSQISQQTSDNRKMALEISKLKVNIIILLSFLFIDLSYGVPFCSQSQLATNSTALAASKEEIKKLELQLKKVQTEADSTVNGLQKQHTSVVRKLEEKVYYTDAMLLNNNIHTLYVNII